MRFKLFRVKASNNPRDFGVSREWYRGFTDNTHCWTGVFERALEMDLDAAVKAYTATDSLQVKQGLVPIL